jgi:hypothetical protein
MNATGFAPITEIGLGDHFEFRSNSHSWLSHAVMLTCTASHRHLVSSDGRGVGDGAGQRRAIRVATDIHCRR